MEKTCVVNWHIKDFKFWEDDIRLFVDGQTALFSVEHLNIHLYAREGFLVVRASTVKKDPDIKLSGDLCFVLPDGSRIGERITFDTHSEYKGKPKDGVRTVRQKLTGPPSKEVLERLKKFPSDENRLTIRLRLRSRERQVHDLHTKLMDVERVSLKVSLSQLEDGKPFEHKCLLEYHKYGCSASELVVSAGPDAASKVEFALVFTKIPHRVHARWSFLAADGSVIRSEQKKYDMLFTRLVQSLSYCSPKHTLFDHLTREDVRRGGYSAVVLHLTMDYRTPDVGLLICTQYVSSTTHLNAAIRPLAREAPVDVLAEQFKSLYLDKEFTDFKITCCGVMFPVHRAILAVRSPIFKSMLSGNIKEAASGEVDIVDLEPSTLSRFLAFLYTGAVGDLGSDIAFKLYYAADKYQVPCLKRVCSDFLLANISASNVDDILSLGERHQDHELATQAREFISQERKRVHSESESDTLSEDRPPLSSESDSLSD